MSCRPSSRRSLPSAARRAGPWRSSVHRRRIGGIEGRGPAGIVLWRVQDVTDLDRVAAGRVRGLLDVDLLDVPLGAGAGNVGEDLVLELLSNDVALDDRSIFGQIDAGVGEL